MFHSISNRSAPNAGCRWIICLSALHLLTLVGGGNAATVGESGFRSRILPFLDSYCVDCHSGEEAKAKFDLSGYGDVDSVIRDHGHWRLVLDRLEAGDMPPKKKRQPPGKDRQFVIDWIKALRKQEAERNAGDPGIVLARRLSNAEYDYTIRDLTGVDIRPTREFPIDPANEAGFDNSGESLTLSPALLKKYLSAARSISEHLVLKSDGIGFAGHPVVTNTDRDKFCVQRIIEFYQRQETNLTEYFFAAWETRQGRKPRNLKVSPKYLKTIRELLEGKDHHLGPIASLRQQWREMPLNEKDARGVSEEMAETVRNLRHRLSPQFEHLDHGRTIHRGSQAFVYWWNRKYRDTRRTLDPAVVDLSGLGTKEQERTLAAYERFCSVFPNLFLRSERSRDYLPANQKGKYNNKGRLLSAGLHSQPGYFRDDRPVCELLLSKSELAELDKLWLELDMVARAPVRQYKGMVWFERTDSEFLRSEEFDFARAEDHDVVSPEMIRRLREAYLKKAISVEANETMVFAITNQFAIINQQIRRMERNAKLAESVHLGNIMDFAERAYRRPLTMPERDGLQDFYQRLRTKEEASHEDAMRDLVVSILVSPHFWFRADLPAADSGVQPLSDHALASRLSYFLWSSMPDGELIAAANRGELQDPRTLLKQVRRMIGDDRVRGLAVEFGGNWLEFRQFQNHNSVDRERFPRFTDDLHAAMFEEPIRFFCDVAQSNRSILEFLFSDHTIVNAPLADHYGLPDVADWTRVPARSRDRGGLLPMAVFQTHNAGGLRTSPVKRGYWVVRRLLGEHIPPPPPNVPDLAEDEGIGKLSLREQLAAHRDHPNCAACHERFDSIGLAFEAYGPIGELRRRDLGDRTVDDSATFPEGGAGRGLHGLQTYLREYRLEEFIDNLCRKFFSYALGRQLMLSDDPAIATMKDELKKSDYRFGALVESIVTSRQFRHQRGRMNVAQSQNGNAI